MPEKIALVTGASRGLGTALAEQLAFRGWHVVAVARTVGGLEDLDDRVKAAGMPGAGGLTLAPMDITDDGAMRHLCRSLFDRWGGIGLWAHAAIHAAPLALPRPSTRRLGEVGESERHRHRHPDPLRDAAPAWPTAAPRCSSTIRAQASPSSDPTARPRARRWHWRAAGRPKRFAPAPAWSSPRPPQCPPPRARASSSPARTVRFSPTRGPKQRASSTCCKPALRALRLSSRVLHP